MAKHFNYLVIGGGSGGIASARRAAEYGASVVLFEDGAIGGTCVNVGCVPKKVMWSTSRIAEFLHDAKGYGFDVTVNGFSWPDLKSRRDAYITRLNGIYDRNLANSKVEQVNARARFVDDKTVEAGGERYTADHILIATGGFPTWPDIPGAEHGISSDGFFELEDRPAKVAVVGAGYIAAELAGVLQGLGSDVSLFLRKDSVLRSFDSDLQEVVMENMAEMGMDLRRQTQLTAIEKQGDGSLTLTTDAGDTLAGYDCLIWAIGRAPATEDLGLEQTGIKTDARGFIPTDDFQNTNVANVHAVGDVTGRDALTPVAIAAGRKLSDRLFDKQSDARLEYENIATVIFTHPPIGTVGVSEEQARAEHGDAVKVYRSRFVNMYFAVLERKQPTVCKLICLGPEEKVIGCHVVGEAADEIIQGFAVAVRMGATKADFDRTVAIHPTAGEELVTMR